ncbi:WD40 repeat-like protein [Microthyrium microscopicum]|uniref:WD40 repeat-like protein n=1 Tax=Microthyrium microscopicum TaxID=703497 RepID=A0A6A6UF96_9PEZI|nr:WD40 repeat-like protein [Microthyrium microscopicum]
MTTIAPVDTFPTSWPYFIAKDFQKAIVPARWADGHPKQWQGAESSITTKDRIRDGALSQDSRYLAVASASEVTIYSITDGKICQMLTCPEGRFQRVLLRMMESSPSKDYCLLADFGSIPYPQTAFWKLDEHGKVQGTNKPVLIIKASLPDAGCDMFHPSSQYFLVYERERLPAATKEKHHSHNIEIWDADFASLKLRIEDMHDEIMSWVDFSPDGSTFATSSMDQTAKIWNAASGALVRTFGPTGHQNWRVAHSPDGSRLACGHGSGVLVWQIETGETIFKFDSNRHWVRSLAWHPSSKCLAYGHCNGGLQIRSVESGKVFQEWQLDMTRWPRQDTEVLVLGWFDGGRKLAFATGLHAGVEVYDVEENIKWRFAPSDEDSSLLTNGWRPLVPAYWIADNKSLLCLDADNKIRVWNL